MILLLGSLRVRQISFNMIATLSIVELHAISLQSIHSYPKQNGPLSSACDCYHRPLKRVLLSNCLPLYYAEHIMTAYKPCNRLRFPTVISAFSSLFELIYSPYHSIIILALIFESKLKKCCLIQIITPLYTCLLSSSMSPRPHWFFITGGTIRSHTLIQNFLLCEPGVDTVHHQKMSELSH